MPTRRTGNPPPWEAGAPLESVLRIILSASGKVTAKMRQSAQRAVAAVGPGERVIGAHRCGIKLGEAAFFAITDVAASELRARLIPLAAAMPASAAEDRPAPLPVPAVPAAPIPVGLVSAASNPGGFPLSGAALRPDHGIDAGSRLSSRAVFGDEELPIIRVEGGARLRDGDLDLAGGGRRCAGGRVDRAMADHEQGPAGTDAGRHPLHHLLDRPGYMDVEADHEVVPVLLRRPGPEVGLDPVDALGDVRAHDLGCRPGMGEGCGGEVDGGDPPAARREPERVGPMAAAGIERVAGTQVTDLGGQMGVGGPLRNAIPVLAQDLRPAVFPEALAVPAVSGHVHLASEGPDRNPAEPLCETNND